VGVAIETTDQLETDAEQDEYKGIFGWFKWSLFY
jgi:hypothetical protein